jgi:hypothetical protein
MHVAREVRYVGRHGTVMVSWCEFCNQGPADYTTPAPTWDVCCNRRTSSSIEAAHRPYYVSLTAAGSWESNSEEENLVLRAKCMNRDASVGTGG